MPVSDINALRNSKIVKRIVQTQVDSTGDAYVLKARAELVNGWSLHYWEHGNSRIRRYSFHVLLGRKMIVQMGQRAASSRDPVLSSTQAHRKNDSGFK